MRKTILLLAVFFILALVPLQHVLAQPAQGPACVSDGQSTQLCNPISYAADWKTFIFRAIQILTTFFLLVPVMRIAFAGFLMVTAQGNEESLTRGKNALQWSVLSIVLAMFAFVIIQALGNYLEVQDRTGSYAGNNPVYNPIAANDFGALLTRMLVGFLSFAGLFAVFMIIMGSDRGRYNIIILCNCQSNLNFICMIINKITMIKKLKYICALLVALAIPSVAWADNIIFENPATGFLINLGDDNTFRGLILKFITLALSIAGILAIAFIIYGGLQYITSAGNEEQAESGKKTLLNAIIGVVIIVLSYAIVAIIENALN